MTPNYNPGWTMHAIKCFKDHCDDSGIKLELDSRQEQMLERFAQFLLVQGVKIGGIYQHFKGLRYKVTGLARDSENWPMYRVQYAQVDDLSHEASRPIDEFLGLHESGIRRFTLVQ